VLSVFYLSMFSYLDAYFKFCSGSEPDFWFALCLCCAKLVLEKLALECLWFAMNKLCLVN
jgi:hypothetical protein